MGRLPSRLGTALLRASKPSPTLCAAAAPLQSSTSVLALRHPPPTTPRRTFTTSPALRACKMPSSHETIPTTSIRVLRTVPSLRAFRDPLVHNHRLVGLVPTMGALHEGHFSLIRLAARENHHVIVSIYLNPAQFGASEDFASYPSTWAADVAAIAKLDRELAEDGANLGRVSAVFAPSTADMYPEGFPGQEVDSKGSFVSITPVGEVLEGKSRPTFFRGVATVCMKLFNAVRPDRVYFGQKDAQQTVIIRRLVRDFLMPIDVVIGPTMRDADGLAQSSRNAYLGTRRRAVATVLSRALKAAENVYVGAGVADSAAILDAARGVLQTTLDEQNALPPTKRVRYVVDYISVADPDTMQEVEVVDPERGAILSGAIRMLEVEEPWEGEDLGHSGGPPVRLIDNIRLLPRSKE